MKICDFKKGIEKMNEKIRKIEKYLAGLEKASRNALKQLRGENEQNK